MLTCGLDRSKFAAKPRAEILLSNVYDTNVGVFFVVVVVDAATATRENNSEDDFLDTAAVEEDKTENILFQDDDG